jgi:hypothetical protein
MVEWWQGGLNINLDTPYFFLFDIQIWLQQDSCSKEPHGPSWMTFIILSSSFLFSPPFKLKFAGSDSILIANKILVMHARFHRPLFTFFVGFVVPLS